MKVKVNKIKVEKLGFDWTMTCPRHRERVYCETWADAYEVAAGHAVMHHPGRVVYLRESRVPGGWSLGFATAVFLDVGAEFMRVGQGARKLHDADFLSWIADEIDGQSEAWA